MNTPREDLQPFVRPRGIAVIGATDDPRKLGYGVMRNLLHPEWGFPGPVYPVNPRRPTVMGRPAYPAIADVPDPVDLALILIPAAHVPDAVAACGRRGVRGVVVLSGGFRELGPEGERLQARMVAIAREYGMRLMGPNGIGVIDTTVPLNTTFIRAMPHSGPIGFVSQSGALCGGVVDWTRPRGIGLSRLYSVGNQADLTETDFLEFLAEDPATRVICLYVEEISDGRRFYEVASRITAEKPVLLLKAGRTTAGQEAARSHTGALAGEVAAYQAICADAGIHWCTGVREMFEAAHALAHTPWPRGRRTLVITNAGGPAAVAADALAEAGLRLAHPSPATQERLREVLPPAAQVASVVDMLGAAGPAEYAAAVRAAQNDPQVDAALVIHVPQATVDPIALVDAVLAARGESPAPLVLAFPGAESTLPALHRANRQGLPAVTFPEDAARVLRHLAEQADVIARPRRPVDRPATVPRAAPTFPPGPTLTDWDLRPVLTAYGIPVPPAALAQTPEEAAQAAAAIGFPVALKLLSPDALHKTDIGGVALGLADAAAVREAAQKMLATFRERVPHGRLQGLEVQAMAPSGVEVILGIVRDPQFGPLIMCGTGGVLVEVIRDVAFAAAP